MRRVLASVDMIVAERSRMVHVASRTGNVAIEGRRAVMLMICFVTAGRSEGCTICFEG